MRNFGRFCLILVFFAPCALGQQPFLSVPQWRTLRDESSGAAPYENLRYLTGLHRVPATPEFDQAAQFILQRAREYGLADARSEQFPIDGSKPYGLMRSYLGWTVEEGRLWEVRPQHILLGDWKTDPIRLADYSHSADIETELVDVGDGAGEADYSGKDVRGKIVLADGVLARVQELAIVQRGAAGIVSDMPNQTTAWSGLDTTIVRWGHLEARQASGFAFMISRQTAEALRLRLHHDERIILNAHVKAMVGPGHWTVVTAAIPGTDPAAGEIIYSCHLDHERPGANDNASGCVTILEVARTLRKLIGDGTLARPARTLRFIWPPEVEGTVTLLNAKPELAKRIKAVVHMDMVGGGPETKAVYHVTRGPMSLPSFVHDVAWAFADWINAESYRFAATGAAGYPLTAPEGGREPLRAMYSAYTMGSDHDVYQDSSFGIPAIYMNDWPDRYIHTNLDTAANIDPTKLKRAAFIGAASGYFLANLAPRDAAATDRAIARGKLLRTLATMESGAASAPALAEDYERAVLDSFDAFNAGIAPKPQKIRMEGSGAGAVIYRRRSEPRGPLVVFGYDYFVDHAKSAGIATPKLLSYEGIAGSGEEYAYEALNFADGRHTAQQIANDLSAEYGPVPLGLVVEYLQALKRIGVVD